MNVTKPIGAKITLSEICNHKCPYCYNKPTKPDFDDIRKDDFTTLSKEEYSEKYNYCNDNLNKIISTLAENEILYLKFTGGEPFMTSDLLFEGLRLCKTYNLKSIINTNLTIYNDEISAKLKEYSLRKLNVTFLSHKQIIYNKLTNSKNYKIVLTNLKKAQNDGFDIEVAIPVTRVNLRHIYKTIKFIRDEIGIKKMSVFPVEPTQKKQYSLSIKREELKKIFDQIIKANKKLDVEVKTVGAYPLCCVSNINKYQQLTMAPCRMGVEEISLSLNGNIKACTATNKIYGNILTDGFKRIIEVNEEFRNYRNKKSKVYPAMCKSCKMIKNCTLGCRSTSESITGKLFGKNKFMGKPYKKEIQGKKYTFSRGEITMDLKDVIIRREVDGNYLLVTNKSYDLFDTVEIDLLKKIHKYNSEELQKFYKLFTKKESKLRSFLKKLIKLKILKVEKK